MKLDLLFLIPEELHHKLMFVCPTCGGQTFTPCTTELAALRCIHCGTSHDGHEADFEVLCVNDPPPGSRHGRNLPEPEPPPYGRP